MRLYLKSQAWGFCLVVEHLCNIFAGLSLSYIPSTGIEVLPGYISLSLLLACHTVPLTFVWYPSYQTIPASVHYSKSEILFSYKD